LIVLRPQHRNPIFISRRNAKQEIHHLKIQRGKENGSTQLTVISPPIMKNAQSLLPAITKVHAAEDVPVLRIKYIVKKHVLVLL